MEVFHNGKRNKEFRHKIENGRMYKKGQNLECKANESQEFGFYWEQRLYNSPMQSLQKITNNLT